MVGEPNKKFEGSILIDCRPQTGDCPGGCNQCYYNRMPTEYKRKQNIPSIIQAEGKIVRMNAEHDSNCSKPLVVHIAQQYADSFFNTSRPDVQFSRPVVLTVNPREEDEPSRWTRPRDVLSPNCFDRILFIRYRVSAVNYLDCIKMSHEWAAKGITSIFTFMRYYDASKCPDLNAYEEHLHILHKCLQLKTKAKESIMTYAANASKLIAFCGTLHSDLCKDCGNCESYYRQAKKHMIDLGIWR